MLRQRNSSFVTCSALLDLTSSKSTPPGPCWISFQSTTSRCMPMQALIPHSHHSLPQTFAGVIQSQRNLPNPRYTKPLHPTRDQPTLRVVTPLHAIPLHSNVRTATKMNWERWMLKQQSRFRLYYSIVLTLWKYSTLACICVFLTLFCVFFFVA